MCSHVPRKVLKKFLGAGPYNASSDVDDTMLSAERGLGDSDLARGLEPLTPVALGAENGRPRARSLAGGGVGGSFGHRVGLNVAEAGIGEESWHRCAACASNCSGLSVVC